MLDAVVSALSPVPRSAPLPALTFGEIASAASEIAGRPIGQPAIRACIYRKSGYFERIDVSGVVKWRLKKRTGKGALALMETPR